MENLFLDPTLIIIIAAIVGFFMAYGIGANDVANAMGTSVGSKAITLKQAVIIAAIFEFLGAYFAGGEVTSTIRKGIVDPAIYIIICNSCGDASKDRDILKERLGTNL